MRNGLRRQRVIFEKPAAPEVRDPFGDVVETWETHATRWAFVEPFQGREFFDAQQMQATADHRIWLPYDAETAQISPRMRARYGTRVFDITTVLNTATRNAELQVIAKERLAA